MAARPRVLIEDWLPVAELGIESRRERAAASALPPLYFLHVWWARRPLVASAGAVLGSLMPVWSAELASRSAGDKRLATESGYRQWFLRLCGILGDPVTAKRLIDRANDRGERLAGNGYGYKQAYRNSPTMDDFGVLNKLLYDTWGSAPIVLDPTAGGGSIPFEAIRYGLAVVANELNPVAVGILEATLNITSTHGSALSSDLREFGKRLLARIDERLEPYFQMGEKHERVVGYIFARTVACPRTGKLVPLSPNWWLATGSKPVAVKLITERSGLELDAAEFEIVRGDAIDFDPEQGTVSGGDGISPWDGLAIDSEYIKAEAQAGRMGSQLYAVAVRTPSGRSFRAPTRTDLDALAAADAEFARVESDWLTTGILPSEPVPPGNDNRPNEYGMGRWYEMFSPRQRLAHGTFVEEFQRLVPEVRSALDSGRADATLAVLAMMQGKATNWNGYLSSWDATRNKIRSVFERHDFAFKWTYAEFDGARELYPWCLDQIVDAYTGIAELLQPFDGALLQLGGSVTIPGAVTVTAGNAAHLPNLASGSVTLVCIDPPYYDNVMYAELADFFYVWEKRTLGLIWPDLYHEDLTDKKNEAVANPARFSDAGKRRKELANSDYEAKMTAIFAECHRVLRDHGVMTVMFTHKKAAAWDTLGMALMEAGFTIETSWPVNTESEQSLHQAKKNAAASTIFLVCRKRETSKGGHPYFEDIDADVRRAAREATTHFSEAGIAGVDLLLSTYGPALSVISSQWPVYSSEADETGRSKLLRPEQALDAARAEVVRIQRQRLVGTDTQLDPLTDFALIAWDTFKAAEFPFDEARRLALATGGLDVDELGKAKVLVKKSGTVVLLAPAKRLRQAGEDLPGVRPGATTFLCALDALHTVMYIADVDGLAAARALIDRAGLAKDSRFLACLQGLVNAIPRTMSKGKWVRDEAETLDRLCAAYFPEISIPKDEEEAEVLTLF